MEQNNLNNVPSSQSSPNTPLQVEVVQTAPTQTRIGIITLFMTFSAFVSALAIINFFTTLRNHLFVFPSPKYFQGKEGIIIVLIDAIKTQLRSVFATFSLLPQETLGDILVLFLFFAILFFFAASILIYCVYRINNLFKIYPAAANDPLYRRHIRQALWVSLLLSIFLLFALVFTFLERLVVDRPFDAAFAIDGFFALLIFIGLSTFFWRYSLKSST